MVKQRESSTGSFCNVLRAVDEELPERKKETRNACVSRARGTRQGSGAVRTERAHWIAVLRLHSWWFFMLTQ